MTFGADGLQLKALMMSAPPQKELLRSDPTLRKSSVSLKFQESGKSEGRPPASGHPHHKKHARGLLLIGLLKVGEAALYVAVGIGALRLLHKDLGDLLLSAASHLRLDTEGRFITMLMGKVPLLTDHRLKEIGLGTMGYAAVKLVEGVGLVMEKTWAEYLTLILSVMFLPWEIYELVRRVTIWRAGLTASNLIIVLYLLWFLLESRKQRMQTFPRIVS